MSLVQPTQPPAVLVAIDIAKLRHDVLIEAASIPVGRSRQAQNTTSMSFAYLKAPHQTLHHRSTPRRLYHFFESTGFP